MPRTATWPEMIEVIITARETVHYHQRKKIRKEVYDKYVRMVDEGGHDGKEFDDFFGDYLDPADVNDGDGPEDVEISLAK